ncbi:MAG: hypothetical protein WC455_23365 [Dehalococcoidia bacterium]|jgi:hypothetical protein
MPESIVYLPITYTRWFALFAIRKYILPPTDIVEWHNQGYFCRWVGADIPLQRFILPSVVTPALPDRFLARYGGSGLTYTPEEMWDAMRVKPNIIHDAYANLKPVSYRSANRRLRVMTALKGMGFRKETVGGIFRYLPIGRHTNQRDYPRSMIPRMWVSVEGFIANVLDALQDNVFIWRWRKQWPGKVLLLHQRSAMRWWNVREEMDTYISVELRRRTTCTQRDVMGHKVNVRRIQGELLEAADVMRRGWGGPAHPLR